MKGRQDILSELKNYFSIEELVCDHAFKTWGSKSWQFLSTEYLHCLLVIRRDILKVSMNCNNYKVAGGQVGQVGRIAGQFSQRGLRCNLCELVKDKTVAGKIYLSAHILGAAGDFDCKGFTPAQARQAIEDNQHLLPFPIRMEQGVNWLHFDSFDSGTGSHVTYFKA